MQWKEKVELGTLDTMSHSRQYCLTKFLTVWNLFGAQKHEENLVEGVKPMLLRLSAGIKP